MDNFSRTMAYLDKLPNAISGAGGHDATLRVACECYRFGLSDGEAWEALRWFNDNRCQPKWKEHELRHKLESAYKIVTGNAELAKRISRPSIRPYRRAFVAPQAPKRPERFIPVMYRSEAEEEAWWAAIFAERGIEDPAG